MIHVLLLKFIACFENNIEYLAATNDELNPGAASNADAKESAKECQELCRLSKACISFTWNSNSKACKLLKAVKNRNVVEGMISGPPACRGEVLYIVDHVNMTFF